MKNVNRLVLLIIGLIVAQAPLCAQQESCQHTGTITALENLLARNTGKSSINVKDASASGQSANDIRKKNKALENLKKMTSAGNCQN